MNQLKTSVICRGLREFQESPWRETWLVSFHLPLTQLRKQMPAALSKRRNPLERGHSRNSSGEAAIQLRKNILFREMSRKKHTGKRNIQV